MRAVSAWEGAGRIASGTRSRSARERMESFDATPRPRRPSTPVRTQATVFGLAVTKTGIRDRLTVQSLVPTPEVHMDAHALSRRFPVALAITVGFLMIASAAAPQQLDPSMWVTNGTVTALCRDADRLYVGGQFSVVGPATGCGAVLNTTTGALSHSFPLIQGFSVNVAVADNSGGWFVSGVFDTIGGVPSQGMAHILSDGTISAWNPRVSGLVDCMALEGGTLYIGGTFFAVGDSARSRIAAIDAVTGIPTAWNPSANQEVLGIAARGGRVFACGLFTSIGGQARSYLAAVDAQNGFATAWTPAPSAVVGVLVFAGDTLYVGGQFGVIAGQPRVGGAAFLASDGSLLAWNPNTSSAVSSIAIGDGLVYLGGTFTSVGGLPRNHLAAVDAANGSVTGWTADPPTNVFTSIKTLAFTSAALYVGGDFPSIAGQLRLNAAALDPVTGSVLAWRPCAGNWVNVLATGAGEIFVGGAFTTIGGQPRTNLASFDLATSAPTTWTPTISAINSSGMVNAIAVRNGTVYVGGLFSTAGGLARNNLAAFDGTTAAATSWAPNADDNVIALVIDGNVLYAGGYFQHIGLQTRSAIAAIDLPTGLPTPWDPHAVLATPYSTPPMVSALAAVDGTLFVGGSFTSIGGASRNSLAGLDPTTGLATAWNPNTDGTVAAIAEGDTVLYVGGYFTSLGGQARSYLGAVGIASGLATAWNPQPNQQIVAVTVGQGKVYASGMFDRFGAISCESLASLDPGTGVPTSWRPTPFGSGGFNSQVVATMLASGDHLYVGGRFERISGAPQSHLARYSFGSVSVEAGSGTPALSIRPNPARSRALVQFSAPALADVRLDVYDIGGRLVHRVLDRAGSSSGVHTVSIDVDRWPTGIYWMRLAGGAERVAKLLVVK